MRAGAFDRDRVYTIAIERDGLGVLARRTAVTTLVQNLLEGAPPATGERFRELLRRPNLVIELILSSDRPEPVAYCQDEDEWVLLLQGRARLELAGRVLELGPGDSLMIPARTPHRVLATSGEPHCVWIAVHIHS